MSKETDKIRLGVIGMGVDNMASTLVLLKDEPDLRYEITAVCAGSQATVDRSIVRTTLATDAVGGDGIIVLRDTATASATILGSSIEQSTRSGLTTFGAAVSLTGSRIRCAAFALTGEPYLGSDFALEDGGGNTCGCDESVGACKLVSVGLEPPTADPVD